MNKTASLSLSPSRVESVSSMSSFMSGLLAERAVQFEVPNAQWSINIVDDNARPKHIDKSKIKMLQQRNSQPNPDLRWGSENGKSGCSSQPFISAGVDGRDAPFSPATRFSDTNSVTGRNRLISSKTLPPVPGLRRAAASDTMLLKMPVRTKSPGDINAKPSFNAAAQANARWGSPQQAKQSLLGISKLPHFDLNMDSNQSTTSKASHNLSRGMSRSTNCMTKHSNLMNTHSNANLYSSKSIRRDEKSKKKKSSKSSTDKSSSSDSLKQRASLLGLDLR